MKFSVIIAASRPESVRAAIESIMGQSYVNWELVVVGQAEDSELRESVNKAAKEDKRVRYHHIDRRGLSRARNAGVGCSDGEIIAFTDDDCEARSDWLETMAQIFNSHPDVGLLGGSLIPPPKSKPGIGYCPSFLAVEAVYDPVSTPNCPPPGWDWIECNVGIRRNIFQKAGPLDEFIGRGSEFPGSEGADYTLRLETLGIKMATTPRSVVYHTGGWRYGLKAKIKQTRDLTYGTYGLAGKLTQMGDARGQEWMADVRKQCLTNWLRQLKPYRLPVDLFRLWNATSAYRLCMRRYKVRSGYLFPLALDGKQEVKFTM
jgi:glycosyltransferase involved in cell wall biosynthesis